CLPAVLGWWDCLPAILGWWDCLPAVLGWWDCLPAVLGWWDCLPAASVLPSSFIFPSVYLKTIISYSLPQNQQGFYIVCNGVYCLFCVQLMTCVEKRGRLKSKFVVGE
ncbi:hypothetical protein OTU49_013949, partial [Cherax quadricarinatus]